MIVVDTSAWIEFLRRTGSATNRAVRRLLEGRRDLAVTEVVVMELLAGTRDERARRALRGMLLGLPVLPLHGLQGYEAAAELYRTCRDRGETVRRMLDCLIAVPVIAADAALLHAGDRDFEVLARYTPLQVVDVTA